MGTFIYPCKIKEKRVLYILTPSTYIIHIEPSGCYNSAGKGLIVPLRLRGGGYENLLANKKHACTAANLLPTGNDS